MKNSSLIQIIVAGVCLLVVLAGYVFWYQYVQKLQQEVAILSGSILEKEKEHKRSLTARAGEEDLVAQEELIASHVVQTEDIVSFLEKLEASGTEFGAEVSVASVTGGASVPDGRISLSLSISGSFDGVMRTLGTIEHGSYANMVSDLTLDTADASTWTAVGVFVVATEQRTITP